MKKITRIILLAGGILTVLSLYSCKSMSPDELKSALEVVNVQTEWVSKYYQPWPPRLIIVPVVSFQVKNIGAKPLNYINFNAIFRLKGDPENLGDNFLAAIRSKPVMPGMMSDVITLKSNFGVEGKTLESIKSNPQWKPCGVKLFARSKGSQFVLLGEWDVSRKIDFKEPEPVSVK